MWDSGTTTSQKMCCGTEAGSYLRIIDSCITQLKAQGPSRTCNESNEEEEEEEEEEDSGMQHGRCGWRGITEASRSISPTRSSSRDTPSASRPFAPSASRPFATAPPSPSPAPPLVSLAVGISPRCSKSQPGSGFGFRVLGLGFRVQGSGFRVRGSGFRVQGSGFRVQGSGFRVHLIPRGPGRRCSRCTLLSPGQVVA